MRRTILVVDSDPRTARSLRAALEPRWFAVVEAPDPISLLTLLLWIPVALVVVNPAHGGSHAGTTPLRVLGCLGRQASFAPLPAVIYTDATPKLAARIRAMV